MADRTLNRDTGTLPASYQRMIINYLILNFIHIKREINEHSGDNAHCFFMYVRAKVIFEFGTVATALTFGIHYRRRNSCSVNKLSVHYFGT